MTAPAYRPQIAIVREVSPSLAQCELAHVDRVSIDVELARAQHRDYCDALVELGVRVVAMPAVSDQPDSVFVEDTAVVLDEAAIMTIPGAESRREEVIAVSQVLYRYRPLEFITAGTIDGGDVLGIGRTLYVGQSTRTTAEATLQLRSIVEPAGYSVREVAVRGCLHLKTACTLIGSEALLVNSEWVDVDAFSAMTLLEVPRSEPWAANTILVGDTVLIQDGFPATKDLLEERGATVRTVDISEFRKAEAGLSCLSLLL